jgi:Zn-dependent protease
LLPHSSPRRCGAELDDLLDDVALLIDLDRIDRGVGALVLVLVDRVRERGLQLADARLEDVGEAEQQREADALRVESRAPGGKRSMPRACPVRMHRDVALGIDPEIAEAPAEHVIQLLGVLDRPFCSADVTTPSPVRGGIIHRSLTGDSDVRWSYRIATILGTEIRIHVTFVLLVAWYAINAWSAGGREAAVATAVFVLLVFLCILLHEFGHILAARRYGIRTPEVLLSPIGGLARLERLPEEPRQELIVALAGPAVTLAIVIALGAWLRFTGQQQDLLLFNPGNGQLASDLFRVNVYLLLFNLIPAFPMDGGRGASARSSSSGRAWCGAPASRRAWDSSSRSSSAPSDSPARRCCSSSRCSSISPPRAKPRRWRPARPAPASPRAR